MPVTDSLLKKLQETLGEGPTRDLVGWVNEARTVNRDEVRELAELYLGRFDERLERRLAEVDVRLERRLAELDVRLEQRLAERDVRLEQRLAERDVRLDQRLAELDGRLEQRFADVRVEMGDRLSAHYRDLHRWLFVLWAGTVIPLAGLMVALIKL